MSDIHLEKERSRLRGLVLVSLIALLMALLGVGIQEYQRSWRKIQRGFASFAEPSADPPQGIRQYLSPYNEPDRCFTCHLGMGNARLSKTSVPLPYRSHSARIGRHKVEKMGCSVCHGGDGRALDPQKSHAHPRGERDPLMREPHIQASCVQCHVPGAKNGQERLVEGAYIFASLGCPMCHPLSAGGKGGWDFGPDLSAIRRQTLSEYKTSLLEPAANFTGSTMPSYQLALGDDKQSMDSLLVFLQSLTFSSIEGGGERRQMVRHDLPCATCHAGEGGRAQGRMAHRCSYILKNKASLSCSRCHKETIPKSDSEFDDGRCPFVMKHRDACDLCHNRSGEGSQP